MKANLRRISIIAIFAIFSIQSVAQNNIGKAKEPFISYLYTSNFSKLMKQEKNFVNMENSNQIGEICLIVRRHKKNRRTAKILGITSLSLLAISPLISKANTDIGRGTLITGCAIAPVAVYFGIRSRKH